MAATRHMKNRQTIPVRSSYSTWTITRRPPRFLFPKYKHYALLFYFPFCSVFFINFNQTIIESPMYNGIEFNNLEKETNFLKPIMFKKHHKVTTLHFIHKIRRIFWNMTAWHSWSRRQVTITSKKTMGNVDRLVKFTWYKEEGRTWWRNQCRHTCTYSWYRRTHSYTRVGKHAWKTTSIWMADKR